jgi:hypothetical protein
MYMGSVSSAAHVAAKKLKVALSREEVTDQ